MSNEPDGACTGPDRTDASLAQESADSGIPVCELCGDADAAGLTSDGRDACRDCGQALDADSPIPATISLPDGGHSDRDATPDLWRLRWHVGDLAHYTAWHADFGTVETLGEQYRRADAHPGHDDVIERRTRVGSGNKFHSKPRGSPTDFATVANRYDQYRQSETHPGQDDTIERRTTVDVTAMEGAR